LNRDQLVECRRDLHHERVRGPLLYFGR